MAEKLEKFKWYVSKPAIVFQRNRRFAFFFDLKAWGKQTGPNSVAISIKPDGDLEYLGFITNNPNPDIWQPTNLTRIDVPDVFFKWIIIELFSERLKETLWQK